MKKNVLILLMAFMTGFHFSAKAADHTVQVIDNLFVPATVNIEVGDRVIWQVQPSTNMPHNVTSTWATSPTLNSTNTTFTHTFSSQGTFNYYCSFHGTLTSGMRGSVVVATVTGIGDDKDMAPLMEIYPNPARENVTVKLDIKSPKSYHLTLINMKGQLVSITTGAEIMAATEDGVKMELNNLPSGLYFLRLIANDKIMDTRRLILSK